MKKIIFLLFLIIAGQFFISCYEDDSSLDINKIPGVIIDTTGISKLSVYRFENLVVNPKIITEIDEKDLVYEWKFSLDHNKSKYEILGTDKNLDVQINMPPTSSAWIGSYVLCYTATDKNTDLKYIMTWNVEVKNSLGEGLVVAYSRDNTTTDLSLIMCPEVTTDFEKDDIKKDIYSIANGKSINGIVKEMLNTQIYRADGIFAITDESIISIKKLDYSLIGKNNDLFFNHPAPFTPQAIFRCANSVVYINNNEITGTDFRGNPKFGLPRYSDNKVPSKVASFLKNGAEICLTYYDEINGSFVYIRSFASWLPFKHEVIPNVTGSLFDTENLSNKINLAADADFDGNFLHLLKDKGTNKIELYVLSQTNTPEPKALYDFSSAPEIENATGYVICPNQKVIYYSTNDKIYAIIYGGTVPVFELKYTIPAGEEITTLQLFEPSEYPLVESNLNTTYKQLIMSTYSGEGKVYILPIINLGIGNIDKDKIKTFDGFGKISAIVHQK